MNSSILAKSKNNISEVQFLTNSDIKQIYLDNEKNPSLDYLTELYKQLFFTVLKRQKKFENFLDKEDFLQELSTSLWLAIKTFDCHKDFDFYRWLSWHLSRCTRDFCRHLTFHNSINLLATNTHQQVDSEQEMLILLNEILGDGSVLTDRERLVVFEYFCLGKTLKEIGKDLSLSPERIRQIQGISLQKIRNII